MAFCMESKEQRCTRTACSLTVSERCATQQQNAPGCARAHGLVVPRLFVQEEDTGATAVEVERYVKERLGENRAGVYAIRDSSNAVQYVGYARSILSAVKVSHVTEPPYRPRSPAEDEELDTELITQAHLLAVGPERCSSLQTRVLPPRIMASRGRLQADAEAWLMELPSLPPGNAADRDLWEVCIAVCLQLPSQTVMQCLRQTHPCRASPLLQIRRHMRRRS